MILTVKDIRGNYTEIDLSTLILFGMDVSTIASLRSLYLMLGGRLPITFDNITDLAEHLHLKGTRKSTKIQDGMD